MKNASDIDDDTLQRFYDGDLTPLEEHRVQASIERDPAAQRRLAELGQLTELLRQGAEQLGESVHSAGLYAAIEARLAEPDQTTFTQRFRLVGTEWFEHRRSALVPFMAATAVAAVTFLAVIKPSEPGMLPAADEASAAQASEPSSAPGPEVHGTRIEDVDFGASTGTSFEVDNGGVPAAVVWISDEEVE